MEKSENFCSVANYLSALRTTSKLRVHFFLIFSSKSVPFLCWGTFGRKTWMIRTRILGSATWLYLWTTINEEIVQVRIAHSHNSILIWIILYSIYCTFNFNETEPDPGITNIILYYYYNYIIIYYIIIIIIIIIIYIIFTWSCNTNKIQSIHTSQVWGLLKLLFIYFWLNPLTNTRYKSDA